MAAVLEVVLQHGWAWDAGAWQGWRAAAGARAKFQVLERGYFGRPAIAWSDIERQTSCQIVVAHSLGLHFLSAACLERAQLLVIVGGFQRFHPEEGIAARRSGRVVQRMLERLPLEPWGLIDDFYTQCFAPAAKECATLETANIQLLERDLKRLHTDELELTVAETVPRTLLLHGGADCIVPLERAEHLHSQLPSSQLRVFADAGHALPFTHTQACWDVVEQVWQQREI